MTQRRKQSGDEGFVLLFALVAIFLALLTLTIAAPRIAKSIQRDREVEAAHRANQYVRAIRVYYIKFHHYPGSVDQLEKSNNQRFLRQKYLDPLTGKDDWRLIHVGENKTTVKGFFGQDLPGLGAGLGAAGGLTSGTGGTTGSSGSGSSFNNSGIGGSGAGASGSPGAGSTGIGSSGTTESGSTGSGSGSGISSQDATSASGSGGGPIMGIGSSASGDAMLVVNEQTNYQDWEFLYDPKIEALYAKGSLLGGVPSAGLSGSGGTGTSNGFGSSNGLNGPGSSGGSNGGGSSPGTGSTPTPQQ